MSEKLQNFLSITSKNQAQFAFQFYRVLTQPERLKIYQIPNQSGTFLICYKNFLTFYGHKGTISELLYNVYNQGKLDRTTRWEILFQNHHRTVISNYFDDFDIIEEAGGEGSYNNLVAMSLNKSNFTPKRQLKTGKRIRSDLLDHFEEFDPNLKDIADKGGYIYGILEDTELKSIASIPFVYKKDNISFAILHNVYTKEKYRNKGYGTGSVRSALNFLFTRKAIKSVYLWVDEANPAIHIFKKIGFEHAGNWIGTRCFLKDL